MDRGMHVSVDRDFARFGSKSYAINKINSVDVRWHKPHSRVAPWFFGLLAFIFAIAFLGSLESSDGMPGTMIFLTAACAALSWWTFERSKIVEYKLFLTTSSREAQALVSRDGDMIGELRGQIESAMAGQPL